MALPDPVGFMKDGRGNRILLYRDAKGLHRRQPVCIRPEDGKHMPQTDHNVELGWRKASVRVAVPEDTQIYELEPSMEEEGAIVEVEAAKPSPRLAEEVVAPERHENTVKVPDPMQPPADLAFDVETPETPVAPDPEGVLDVTRLGLMDRDELLALCEKRYGKLPPKNQRNVKDAIVSFIAANETARTMGV